MRTGATLIELTVVIAIVAIMAAVGLPPLISAHDHASVRSATTDLVAVLARARHSAVLGGRRVAVRFDTAAARVLVIAGADTLGVHPLRATHGVSLATSRDSITYGPLGVGYGASNTTITLSRRAATDTVIISRLGRVRH
ncbi:MAG: GspH/FimT family pseudopilin [Gemmatimonadaceae bacterium]